MDDNQEVAVNPRAEVAAAMQWIRNCNNFDVRNLVSLIEANIKRNPGADCVDVWALAKALAVYKNS